MASAEILFALGLVLVIVGVALAYFAVRPTQRVKLNVTSPNIGIALAGIGMALVVTCLSLIGGAH